MKYAIIGWNDKTQKRGAYTEAAALQSKYPDKIDVFDANHKLDIDEIHQNYKRVIYTYQNPNKLYDKKVIDVHYYNKDIVYIRKDIKTVFQWKTTNGFSMYLKNNIFCNYVPMMIPMFQPDTNIRTDKIVLGYYLRPQYRPDDYQMFCDFIYNLKIPVDLYVMGSFAFPFNEKINNYINNIIYTTDNVEFFNNITHYVYSMSKVFDPWPTTLQEAVNANKQIIILEQKRNFKDGIDDICENIKYRKILNPEIYYNNFNSIINKWNYDKFYNEVFANNFEYYFDRNRYKYIADWLSQF